MAPSRSATSITWSVWTNRNSASLSTNFLMSQGQATRSTLTCSRVIHFIEIFSFSVNMLSSSSSLLTARLAGELRIQCIVDEPPPFQRDLVVGAYQAQAPANQIQASSRGLQADLLHGIGLIDHAGDALQDGIVQIVLAQHGVKRAVSPVVGEPHARDIKRLCPFRQRFVSSRNEQEFGCWIKIPRDEPGAGHAVHAHQLPGDPLHEADPPLALIRRARAS